MLKLNKSSEPRRGGERGLVGRLPKLDIKLRQTTILDIGPPAAISAVGDSATVSAMPPFVSLQNERTKRNIGASSSV